VLENDGMKKFDTMTVIVIVLIFSSFSFAYAQDSANAKLLTIEETLGRIRELQTQTNEKQSQIQKELDSLRITINRFCKGS
jgi:hypothetical protein